MSKNQIIEALNLKELTDEETTESTELVEYDPEPDLPSEPTEEEKDAEYAIENQKKLIEQSKKVMEHLVNIATQAETGKIFEVFAMNLKAQSDLNKDLLEMHQTKSTIAPQAPKEPETPTVNNNLILSTADFQKMIQEAIEEK